MYLPLLLAFTFLSQGLQAFQLTGPLQNANVTYACQGTTVSLPWQVQLGPGEMITVIQWLYRGSSEAVIAVMTHGAFVPFPTFTGRVNFIQNAGITLGPTRLSDSGRYTVQITGTDAAGNIYQLRHSVFVQISDHLMTADGTLRVSQNPIPVLDPDTGKFTVELLCGMFTFQGNPPYSVQWVTPSGAVQNSSSYDNGYFHLRLTGAVEGGRYTCRVPRQDLNKSCTSALGSDEAEASIVVDGVDVRLTLLEKQNQQLSQELQQGEEEDLQQTQTLLQLTAQTEQLRQRLNDVNTDLTGSIRLVGGHNEREGRVEIRVGQRWGTICDDSWDDDDAKVVCNSLGYFAPGATARDSAFFGEGTGHIVLDDVSCDGTENDIKLCPASPFGVNNCGHSEDAGVVCVGY